MVLSAAVVSVVWNTSLLAAVSAPESSIKAAFLLKPVHARLFERLKASGKLFADETTAPVLDPGRGRTKTGQLFVLHRDTGAPIFPVEERPVPVNAVPGEEASPTQPVRKSAL